MPGELGNEFEQFGVGYYENRYQPHGEWNDDTYGAVRSWSDEAPKKKKGVMRIIKKMMEKGHQEGKSDQNGKFK